MNDKILIFSNSGDRYREAILKQLPGIDLYVSHGSKDMPIDPAQITVLLAWIIKPELLAVMKALKWIHSLGAGVDSFFKQKEYIDKIILTRSVANLPRLMAQYSVGAVIGDNVGFEKYRANQSAKNWAWEPFYDLDRKTALIVGTGFIGGEIARSLKFFGMKILGVNRNGRKISGFDEILPVSEIDEALKKADYIILAIPLTPETRGLINIKRIEKMKTDAVLINIARGAVIIENDLIEALDKGLIRKAVLDVFEKEPLNADSPLWTHPRAVITPHIAGVSDVAFIADEFVQNYNRYIKGEPLLNIVDKDRQY